VLVPKLFTTLTDYSRRQFVADLIAGVIVGVVAIPLAIAFAIASGVGPERGLYTAIVAGFLISALGGSRVQIGGPTGAFVIIVYGIVQSHGVDGLIVATMMAGALLVALGLFTAAVSLHVLDEVATALGRLQDALPDSVTDSGVSGSVSVGVSL